MTFFIIILLLLSSFLCFTAIKIIPEGHKAVIFSMGRFSHVASPGLIFLASGIQKVEKIYRDTDKPVTIKNAKMLFQDGIENTFEITFLMDVKEIGKAMSEVSDFEKATEESAKIALKDYAKTIPYDELIDDYYLAEQTITDSANNSMAYFGVEIKDLKLRPA